MSQDINSTGTVRDLPLYQYATDGNGISTWADIRHVSSGSNVVNYMSNGKCYVQYFENNVLKTKQIGSLDPSNLTATPGDVKSGKIFGGANSDEPQTGTFGGQSKTATPSRASQTISPDSGKYLSSVVVEGAKPSSGERKVYADWYYNNQHNYTVTGITVGSLIIVRTKFASGSGFSIQSGMTNAYTSSSTAGNTETVRIGYATATSITFAITGGEVYLIVDEVKYSGD